MSKPSDDEVDYLLKRGRLGDKLQRRVLRDALASARPATAARRRWFLFGTSGVLVAATAAAVGLVIAPRHGEGPTFRAKGHLNDVPHLEIACMGATVKACPVGSLVAFSLEGSRQEGGFLSAYADGTRGAERVWYLTNEPVSGASTAADGSIRVMSKAARIGAEQPPGHYAVHLILTRRPIPRAELARASPADVVARDEREIEVFP